MAILGIYVILAGQPILSLLVSLDFRAGCLSPMSAEKVFSKSGDEPRTLPP